MLMDEIIVEGRPSNHRDHTSSSSRRKNEPHSPELSLSLQSPSAPRNDALVLRDYPMPDQMQFFGATRNNPSWEITRMDQEARNQADIAGAVAKAHFISQNNRPMSTKVAYNSKQKLWRDWCMKRKFDDLDTVSAGKMILWLQETVIPNGVILRGKTRRDVDRIRFGGIY